MKNLKTSTIFAVILLLTPIAICAWYIGTFGVNVPYQDDFTLVWYFKQLADGHIVVPDIVNLQHAEHKILVPTVLIMLCTAISKSNFVTLMFLSVGVLCCTWLLMLSLAKHRLDNDSHVIWLLAPISWILFTLKQYQSLLWGIAAHIFISGFLFTATVWLLDKSRRIDLYFFFGLISACLCTLSAANGLLALCLGLAQLIGLLLTCRTQDRENLLKKVIIWACASSLALLYHLTHYRYEHYGPQWHFGHSIYDITHTVIQAIEAFCAGLANPLAIEPYSATAYGVFIILIIAWLFVAFCHADRTTKHLAITPITLLTYGIATVMLMLIGRGSIGANALLTSRYCTYLSIGIAGLYMFLLTMRNVKPRYSNIYLGAFIGILFVSSITSFNHGLVQGEALRNERLLLSNMTRHYDIQPESAFTFQRNSTQLAGIVGSFYNLQLDSTLCPPAIELCKYMKENHLSLFADASPSLAGLAKITTHERPAYLLERINDEPVHTYPLQRHVIINSKKVDYLFFKGYALDFKYRQPSTAVFVCIDDKHDIPTAIGLASPDVDTGFHSNRYRYCGFGGTCKSTLPGKGAHTITLKIISPDKQHYFQTGPLAMLEIR